jgi:hypothetical protein
LFWLEKDEKSHTYFFPRRDKESIRFTVDKRLKKLYLNGYIKSPILVDYNTALVDRQLPTIDNFRMAKLVPLEYCSFVNLADGLDYKFQAFKLDGCFICRFAMDNTRFMELQLE